MTEIVYAENVRKTFGPSDNEVVALDNINFTIYEGELTVILGPSGAGKSTLLNLLGGMDRPTSGTLLVKERDLASFTDHQLTQYRRREVGFVFQFYNLMPNLTAIENLELAIELKDNALKPEEVLRAVGLSERMNYFPNQLSGGEQQRVSIARALAKNPRIILCDEPTGALDYQTGKDILALLSDAARKEHKTVIIVTHNSALAAMADHLLRIKNGKIAEDTRNETPMDIKDIEW